MDKISMSSLARGDIVRNVGSPDSYVVTETYGGNRAVAVRTVDITNPDEWILVKGKAEGDKAQRTFPVSVDPGTDLNMTASQRADFAEFFGLELSTLFPSVLPEETITRNAAWEAIRVQLIQERDELRARLEKLTP